jgi:hypothetical protein
VPGFKTLIYFTGRAFQLIGLLIPPYALWLGSSTSDPKTELSLLALGAGLFLVGVVLTKTVASK